LYPHSFPTGGPTCRIAAARYAVAVTGFIREEERPALAELNPFLLE